MRDEVSQIHHPARQIRPGRLALAGMGLVLVVGLILHFLAGWKKPPSSGRGINPALEVTPTNLVVAGRGDAQRTPGGPETEASRLLGQAQAWQRNNPAYHLHIETSSPGWVSIAEVYRFTNALGELVSRASSEIVQPVRTKLILQVESARVVVFFPRLNQTLEFDHEQDIRNSVGVAGLTTGHQGVGLPTAKPRSSFVESGPGFKALTMMFSGRDLGLAEGSGAVFLTLKLDEAGRPLEVEELTLGHRVTSKLTYLSFDQAVVTQEAPVIPLKARRATKSLQEVLREELKPTRNTHSTTI